jgi:hypothetical protein
VRLDLRRRAADNRRSGIFEAFLPVDRVLPVHNNPLLYCASLFLFAAGCAGGYDDDFKSASQHATEAKKFDQLGEARFTIGQLPVSVRLPKQLPEVYIRVSSSDPLSMQPRIDPLRAVPPYMTGFAQAHVGTFEVWNPADEGKAPVYVAFWTPPATRGGRTIVEQLKNALQNAFPGQNFEDVDVRTPEGTTMQWKRLKGSTTTPYFVINADGNLVQQPVKENLDLWAYTPSDGANQAAVVIAWRVPESVESVANFDELAQLVAGSLTGS